MDYSSLPSYPPPLPSRSDGIRQKRERRLTEREAGFLIDLVWLAGIVVLLFWLRQATDTLRSPPPPPPEPLAFKLVAERFARVEVGMTSEEVFSLLGPERYVKFREPEFDDFEVRVVSHPDRYPTPLYWAKWADPDDPARWVAVFIADGRVYHKVKRGG